MTVLLTAVAFAVGWGLVALLGMVVIVWMGRSVR